MGPDEPVRKERISPNKPVSRELREAEPRCERAVGLTESLPPASQAEVAVALSTESDRRSRRSASNRVLRNFAERPVPSSGQAVFGGRADVSRCRQRACGQ